MTDLTNAYIRLKTHLPECVSQEVIDKIILTAIARGNLSIFWDEQLKITYGKSNHSFFHFDMGNFITIYREGHFSLSWLFDQQGELIAT